MTAAQLNAELRNALLGAFPLGPPDVAWTAWTPTLTQLTIGNGTSVAAYTRVGRTIFYRWLCTFGSTSAMGTNPTFTLPVAPIAAASAYGGQDPVIGTCSLRDQGTATYEGPVRFVSGSTASLAVYSASGAYVVHNAVTGVVPHTWAVGDAVFAWGFYEAAA